MSLPRMTRDGRAVEACRTMGAWVPLDLDASSAILANVVEAVTDWDIPDDDAARDLAVQVFPNTSTYLIVQYRTPIRSSRSFGGMDYRHPLYRHVATRIETGVAVVRATGPVGLIGVQLRPEAAARLLG
jgi:hypothetical protein